MTAVLYPTNHAAWSAAVNKSVYEDPDTWPVVERELKRTAFYKLSELGFVDHTTVNMTIIHPDPDQGSDPDYVVASFVGEVYI